uniref:Reverse transcriptase domain-containing protein n=1 Tax=Cannabis sativa TaxID=3483 RepID=A0A803QJP2_CANSA
MASSSRSIRDLEEECANIVIEGKEEHEFKCNFSENEEQKVKERWCIVGHFLTHRPIDFKVMRHMMALLWQPGKEIDLNNVVDQVDKWERAPYHGWLVDRFNKALEDVGLRDMEPEIFGHDMVRMARDFSNCGVLSEGLNATNVVLIPKKKNPSMMGDLRPISLCNVLVKVITKVFSSRMKGLLDVIVSDTQSVFIQARLISNNIMVFFEVMHYLKRKGKGREGSVALKLDCQCGGAKSIESLHCSMAKASEHDTYLGLPNTLGHSKSVIMGFLKDRIWKRVQDWDGKLLSYAWKEATIPSLNDADCRDYSPLVRSAPRLDEGDDTQTKWLLAASCAWPEHLDLKLHAWGFRRDIHGAWSCFEHYIGL